MLDYLTVKATVCVRENEMKIVLQFQILDNNLEIDDVNKSCVNTNVVMVDYFV